MPAGASTARCETHETALSQRKRRAPGVWPQWLSRDILIAARLVLWTKFVLPAAQDDRTQKPCALAQVVAQRGRAEPL